MSAHVTAADLARTVRAGAHFYMAHRTREYPHPDAPEVTMAEHTPNDPDCPGCQAIAALDVLVERLAAAEQDNERLREHARLAEAAHLTKLEQIERAETRVTELERALEEIERAAKVGITQRNRLPDVVGILATVRAVLGSVPHHEETGT